MDPGRPTSAVRIVCFDLGGVLIRICHTWAEALAAVGLAARGEPFDAAIEDERRALTELLVIGRITVEEWAAGVSRVLGGAYAPDELTRVHDAISQEEYAGALALVDELHDAGVETACLSNTNHAHWTRLVHHTGSAPLTGDPEYPSVARLKRHFASHLLALAKPDDAIYAEFERLTDLRGPEILFFDDRMENIEGALRRNWHAHRIDPRGDTIAQVREHLRRYEVLGPRSSPSK
jgi:FMN phosphatase YigB (HAD superfamily)